MPFLPPTNSVKALVNKIRTKIKTNSIRFTKTETNATPFCNIQNPLKENDITTETKTWLDSNLSRQEPEEDLVPASSDEGL